MLYIRSDGEANIVERPNQSTAIDYAVAQSILTGKMHGVYSSDMSWDGPSPDEPCRISDVPLFTYTMLVFVAIPFERRANQL